MPVPKILLVTGTPPGEGSVGEIWLRHLCNAYPRDKICCFTVRKPGFGQLTDALNWLPLKIIDWPFEPPFRPVNGPLGGLWSFPESQYSRILRARKLLREIVNFGKRNNVDLVWAVLDKPIIYRLAASVSVALDIPLVTTVWDPPETVTRDFGLDRISRRIALRDFEGALRRSIRCGVMCEAMQREYKSRYGVDGVVVRYGVDQDQTMPVAPSENREGDFVIGFAGGLYAEREWRALLAALGTVGWEIAGRKIVVRVMGSGIFAASHGRAQIEYLGWRSMPEIMNVLSRSSVNYLPYWFDSSHAISARLCFPTKLTTYLATRKPIFYHGPTESSPAEFFSRYPAGLCCHSLDPRIIISDLERILTDEELKSRMVEAGQRALSEELNGEVFLRRFAELVGIGMHELTNADSRVPTHRRFVPYCRP